MEFVESNIDDCDTPFWSSSKKGSYVSSDTWEILRRKNQVVDLWQLVWFPMAIPKQAPVLWLVMRNRENDFLCQIWNIPADVLVYNTVSA